MAEELIAKNEENVRPSMLDKFMKAGKVRVFESGLQRPDHIQDRPFFNLLEKGATTFIGQGEKPDQLEIKTAKEQAESPYLDTEAHKFFENMEKRFRTVMPDVTIFIIDPDAVQGRYLMDEKEDRSLGKSLYMFVEDKLQKANAGNDKTILTDEGVLKEVNSAGVSGRNPFSLRSSVAPTRDNLAGEGNVNLVIGDNPDAMSANVLDCVLGSEERRVKEGITRDEFRRLVLYHELGHATDGTYASSQNSIEKIAENDLDNVMCRHRTECIADAHAVLQLARDFGSTKCAALWSDCRIEYLRMCVDRRMEDTKYDSDFIAKLRAAEEKSHAINPDDPEFEKEFKTLMKQKETAKVIGQLGSPLAYHTTDVIDATIKYAEEHLKDGSLQKMTDREVIAKAKEMSETYGLTREQMATISIALATGQKHPKYEQMMARVSESRDRMPIARKDLDKAYEIQRERNAYQADCQLSASLGLPQPGIENLSEDLLKQMYGEVMAARMYQQKAPVEMQKYQNKLFTKLIDTDVSREAMLDVLGKEKEALRKAGKNDNGKKDKFAAEKLQVVDAVIDQAGAVQAALQANKRVSAQIDGIKSDTVVSGDEAIAHFVKHELRAMTAMGKMLESAANRDMGKMTFQEQLKVLRAEDKQFGKALVSEKEMQIAAFAIRSDKETWAKVSKNKELAALIDAKAKRKPTAILAQYQMNASNPDKALTTELLAEAKLKHASVVQNVVNTATVKKIMDERAPRVAAGMERLDAALKAKKAQQTKTNIAVAAKASQGR